MSREELINYLYENNVHADIKIEDLADEISAEPKVGKWINDIRYSGWTCTHCNYHDGNRTDNYCPNCGAKMERRADERIHL